MKRYLFIENQTTYTSAEIRRNLRVKETTLRRYHKQLLEEGYIKKVKGKKGQMYHYEIVDLQEYTNLKEQIHKVLENCTNQINLGS